MTLEELMFLKLTVDDFKKPSSLEELIEIYCFEIFFTIIPSVVVILIE